jgi:hypothetical protein
MGRSLALRPRSWSRFAWTLVLSASIAAAVAGCGSLMRLAGVDSTAPGPDAERQELSDRRRAFDDLVGRVADPEREHSGEVVLRLSLTGGWGLPDPGELHMTIQDDGRVIRVTDRSVFSSTGDYTSLRLSPSGILRVLEMMADVLPVERDDLDGGAGVSPTDRSAWLEVGDAIVLSMDRIGQTDGYTREQQERRASFGELLERIDDLSWLGEDVLEPEAAWIPSSMTVLAGSVSARSGLGPGSPFAPWPLERSIEELAVGTTRDPDGAEELVLCLTGDEVPPVFALLTGVNHAYLRVDDGREWELDVRPHYPGYRLVGDPCPDTGR